MAKQEEVVIELPESVNPTSINSKYKNFPAWKKYLITTLIILLVGLICFYFGYELGFDNALTTINNKMIENSLPFRL